MPKAGAAKSGAPTSRARRPLRAGLVTLGCVALLGQCEKACKPKLPATRAEAASQPAEGTITVEGVYRVDPVPRGKRFQGTWLIRDGGKRLLLSYRPVPEYYSYIGKRVRATGSYPKIDPRAQRVEARHFTVQTLTLLPGQEPGPKRIPSPPAVASKGDLAKHLGQWVLLYGKVRERNVSPHESHYLLKLVVALPDGYEISTREQYLRNLRWIETDPTTDVTMIGKVRKTREGGGLTVTFSALCQGRVPRCFVGYPAGPYR